MTTRREFPDRIKALIVKRAMNDRGLPVCEGCGAVLKPKVFEIDHIIAEALIVDKTKALTADDGQLLGPCCHRGKAGKTAKDVGMIAKAKRQERGHLMGRRTSNPIPGSKASGWRKPFNRPAERRT